MDFRVLGSLEVTTRGTDVSVGGSKQRALLVRLLIDSGHIVPTGRLIDDLWGEDPPPTAVKTLRTYVARLRKVLEPDRPPGGEPAILVSHAGGYELRVDAGHIDAQRFEAAATAARTQLDSGLHTEAAGGFRRALDEWRGPALVDLAEYEFARVEATRLRELRLAALEDRIEADLRRGRARDLVAELESLTEAHPYREGLWRQLMVALYQSDRQVEALRAYQSARHKLGEDLGLEPMEDLKRLEERILMQDPTLTVHKHRHGGLHHFPVQRTIFVGRDRELLEISDLLSETRCVTITGIGGAGKTRIAHRLASAVVDAYPDGVYLVELASIVDPDLVLDQVATAMGVLEGGCAPVQPLGDALSTYLHDKQVLLVLDDSEHVLETTAALVERLFDACPSLTLLVTSRQTLGIAGETVYRLLPLALPPVIGPDENPETFEAVRLFETRARSVRSDFHLTAGNVDDVVEICRRLDGIPLAIELAAARVNMLSPSQISARLAHSIRLLSSGLRNDPRHRTLFAAMEWSYRLLSVPEQVLFDRLSVFAGRWDVESLEAVAPEGRIEGHDAFDVLAQLIDKSLVVVEERAGTATYRLLDTVRQYGSERLVATGEAAAVRENHDRWMLDLARTGEPLLRGGGQQEWLQRFDLLQEDFSTTIKRMLSEGALDAASGLVAALGWYWYMRGNWKGARRWVEVCADSGVAGLEMARVVYKVLGIEVLRGYVRDVPPRVDDAREVCRSEGDAFGVAWASLLLGIAEDIRAKDLEYAYGLVSRAHDGFVELGDEWAAAETWMWMGTIANDKGDYEHGSGLLREAVAEFERIGDAWSGAGCWFWIGQVAFERGDLIAAERAYRSSVERSHLAGNRVYEAHAQSGLSNVLLTRDDPSVTESSLLKARELFTRIGDDFCSVSTIGRMGRVAAGKGDHARAERMFSDALIALHRMGNTIGVVSYLVRLASVACARRQGGRAARLLGAVSGVLGHVSSPEWLRSEYQEALGDAEELVLDFTVFEDEFAGGSGMNLDEAVRFATVVALPAANGSDRSTAEADKLGAFVEPDGALRIILFTDMEGSTRLADLLGDAHAQELRRVHDTITRDTLAEHSGIEVKHTGDGFIATFRSVTKALGCSTALQRAFADYSRAHPATPLRIRIGLNAGEPVAERQDLFGTAMNLAARICDKASPGQILVGNVVRELAAGKSFAFTDLGQVQLKGFSQSESIHQVDWDVGSVTR